MLGGLLSLDHHDEEDSALIPATEPADPPAIDTIPNRSRRAKPKKPCLNWHISACPDTCMALSSGTVNGACKNGPPRVQVRRLRKLLVSGGEKG